MCQTSNAIVLDKPNAMQYMISSEGQATLATRSARQAGLDERPLPGDVIADQHKLICVAGRGGMGTVYRANDLYLERTVAIKCLDPFLMNDSESMARFKQEGNVLASLEHDNIARFYAFGVLPSSLPYLVMEWLEGKTLTEVLGKSGTLSAERAIKISLQVADALTHAHNKGVVHRDLKPSNIMIITDADSVAADCGEVISQNNHGYEKSERIKIIDFGVASVTADSGKITSTGTILGTPDYYSPEQGLGLSVDARSDIYALGCVLFEMVCGRMPFTSEHPVGMICQHINSNVPKPSQLAAQALPPGLEALILKCLEKNACNRYQTMHELKTALEKILRGQQSKANSALVRIEQLLSNKKGGLNQQFLKSVACIAFLLTSFAGAAKPSFASNHSTITGTEGSIGKNGTQQ